jgi:hypothetical protein
MLRDFNRQHKCLRSFYGRFHFPLYRNLLERYNSGMSPKEQVIAEAALRGYPAADYEELFAQIAEYTGYTVDEVEEIIADLTTDKALNDRHVPMLHPTPQVDGPAKIVQSWYEKGEMWGRPRMTLRQ